MGASCHRIFFSIVFVLVVVVLFFFVRHGGLANESIFMCFCVLQKKKKERKASSPATKEGEAEAQDTTHCIAGLAWNPRSGSSILLDGGRRKWEISWLFSLLLER